MAEPIPQFKAHIVFTFEEHDVSRRHWFGFDNQVHRAVPMSMESVDGLNTVILRIEGAGKFYKGDAIDADCNVIWEEGYRKAVVPGRKFKLWDGGFFANGEVTQRVEEGWANPKKSN